VADKLREARALIERGWTQKAPARSVGGIEVWGGAASAVCWCTFAAVCTSGHDISFTSCMLNAFRAANDIHADQSITDWNDAPERTQAEVLAAFDKAIALAESDQ
jgi:hypothetical protein